MGYIDRNLLPGEVVAYRAHLHWKIFAPAVLVLLLSVAIYVAWFLLIPTFIPIVPQVFCALLLVVALVMGIGAWIQRASSEFVVTNRRVFVKVGVIERDTVEMFLQKIEALDVDQTIPGRLFGFGSVIITGTGGTHEPFRNIADPMRFREQVYAQAAAVEASPNPSMVPTAPMNQP